MKYTISTHVGHKLSAAHNRRDESSIKDREHIDRTKKHEVWKDEKVTDAYKRIFGAAVKEYNSKQKRKDRQIKNYYQQVKSAAQKHPVYEMIVTIGNQNNQPPPALGKEIMRQFVDDWQKNNPSPTAAKAAKTAAKTKRPRTIINLHKTKSRQKSKKIVSILQ